MNFYYCLDLSRAGTRTHEKVSNWLKTGHENHQTRSTGTRGREPAPAQNVTMQMYALLGSFQLHLQRVWRQIFVYSQICIINKSIENLSPNFIYTGSLPIVVSSQLFCFEKPVPILVLFTDPSVLDLIESGLPLYENPPLALLELIYVIHHQLFFCR